LSNELTHRKIDFFGGTHGHFLELAVNHAIDGNTYDISQNQFTDDGACHLKESSADYVPITKCAHYSWNEHKFGEKDYVIRIVPSSADMLVAVTNSFLRAGDQKLDIDHLENNTRDKMARLSKLSTFLQTLSNNHGISDSYSRMTLRHYFESMFSDTTVGLEMFTNWIPAYNVHAFKFSDFFCIDQFYESLQKIAQFVNLEFRPSDHLINLHEQFLEKNQGWHSHQKCSKIIESIIKKQIVAIDLNIIEEAWISHRISQIFNLYDLSCFRKESFPPTTEEIIHNIQKGLMC
jgi:hypothetical protein